jgi:hypothetical protein
MKTLKIEIGTKVIFTPTGREFILANVTDKRVSWYVSNDYKSGSGKNTLKMAWASMKQFLKGIESGEYKII